MSKLIVTEFMTLDGIMEAPGGEPGHPHSGWVFDHMGDEQMQYKLDETMEAESLLIGRVTYESFAGAWPQREGPFAEKMNAMAKYVVSSTLKEPEWTNTTVIDGDGDGDVVDAIKELKARDGGPILVAGSCRLVHTIVQHNLADEYRFLVFPVVLGSGLRVFADSPDKTPLKLTLAKPFASGVVAMHYVPA
jgi:dihydrofolate reductase